MLYIVVWFPNEYLTCSCGSSGVILRDSRGDVLAQVLRRDPQQAEQADDDSGAPGARPRRGHRVGRRLCHVGPQEARGVLPDQVRNIYIFFNFFRNRVPNKVMVCLMVT